jgi:ribosomal 50S subunit-recycling heat shock protein
MRLDKFLKLSRLIKRRTIAKDMCDASRVRLNDKVAGASAEVSVGQVITIRYGNRQLEAKIERIPERDNVSIQEAPSLYTIVSAKSFTGGPSSSDPAGNDDNDGGGGSGPFVA